MQEIRLNEHLTTKKYPLGLINEWIKKEKKLNTTQLSTPKEKINGNIILFINTHSPEITNLFHAIQANLPYSQKAPKGIIL